MSTTNKQNSDLSADAVLRLVKQVTTLAEQRPDALLEASAALQALLERRPLGYSSLDDKLIYHFSEVWFAERQMREDRFYIRVFDHPVQALRRHRNGGGWVPLEQDEFDESKAFVADTAYVGPFAMVTQHARVLDDASVDGNALVTGNAKVSGQARVYDRAVLIDNAHVSGKAEVSGTSHVSGSAQVSDSAHVFGDARVYELAHAYDHAKVCGSAIIGGTFRIGGFYTLSQGTCRAGEYTKY